MKKIINRFSLFLLAIAFAVSGYLMGSSRQKIILTLAADQLDFSADGARAAAGQINVLPKAKDKNEEKPPAQFAPKPAAAALPKIPAAAGRASNVKSAPKSAPSLVVEIKPAPSEPVPLPSPAPAPQPETKVS